MVKYIKNLISELSSTSDPVDLDEEAFVKETGSTVIKKNLNVSISNKKNKLLGSFNIPSLANENSG